MAEVGPEFFQNRPPESPELHSVEAPERPKAIDGPPVIEGEVLSRSESTSIIPSKTYLGPRYNFSTLSTRKELMAYLHEHVPLNEFNLPQYFYRCDLLNLHDLQETERSAAQSSLNSPPVSPVHVHDILQAATIRLRYDEGYPTLEDGTPFWSRFPFEPKEAFDGFLVYLEQTGARQITLITHLAHELCVEWFHLFNWSARARAYDMFKAAHHARLREQRIMQTEDQHYLESVTMLNRVKKALDSEENLEIMKAMDPDKLVAMYEKLVRIQRISAGLPANGGEGAKETKATTFEFEMKSIARRSGKNENIEDDSDTMAILNDPEMAEAAQSLILRVTGGK